MNPKLKSFLKHAAVMVGSTIALLYAVELFVAYYVVPTFHGVAQ